MRKKTLLVITDGIGHSEQNECNAFIAAKKPTYDYLFKNTPYSMVETFGLAVGLPEGQMGNSEVGHMSIGSGRVLYQDLVKISLALEDGSFAKNDKFIDLLNSSDRLHIIGLMSDGGVHSHIEHIIGVAKIASLENKEVWLHMLGDGRDVAPKSAHQYIDMIESANIKNLRIASFGGRFFAMDRDNRWERVEQGYNAIAKASPKSELSISDYVTSRYEAGESDEFITPTAFSGYDGFSDGDAVLMINFRSDRARELTTAIGDREFGSFARDFIPTHLATISEYDASFAYPVLFEKETPKNTLAEIISKAGLRQLHTAETEKYAHVTFFFNGGIEEPYENETRVLIPSPQVKTYDLQPKMSAPEVGDVVLKAIEDGYDFIVVNFANGDMVGHTGVFDAAVEAVEAVDYELGRIVEAVKKEGYSMILTSDHGNCEEMCDLEGNILTNHTVGSVWCFVMDDEVKAVRDGALNNIAPTVLKLMGLETPEQMDEALIDI